MLDLKQRLIGLYILYEIYLNENVKTTPFYQLVLNLLSAANSLHPAEQKLLMDFLRSVPKVAKQTPGDFIVGVQRAESERFRKDLCPYRKAHAENMPCTSPLYCAAVAPTLCDRLSPSQPLSAR